MSSRLVGTFPGSSDAKRLARLAVYNRVVELQPQAVRNDGISMVLCGEDAGDLGCLRHLLSAPAENTVFVDNVALKGLRKVKRQWPGSRIYAGEIENAVKQQDKLAFLYLDLMGYWDSGVERTMRLASERMLEWGTVFFTFFRGREKPSIEFWDRFESSKAETLEGKRFEAVSQAMQDTLGAQFVPVFSMRYTNTTRREFRNSRHGSMGVVGFQKIPNEVWINTTYWKKALRKPDQFGGVVPSEADEQLASLQSEAEVLLRRGFSVEQIASILES